MIFICIDSTCGANSVVFQAVLVVLDRKMNQLRNCKPPPLDPLSTMCHPLINFYKLCLKPCYF